MRVKAIFAQPLAMFYNNFALFFLLNQSWQSRKTALANDVNKINSVTSRQIYTTPWSSRSIERCQTEETEARNTFQYNLIPDCYSSKRSITASLRIGGISKKVPRAQESRQLRRIDRSNPTLFEKNGVNY